MSHWFSYVADGGSSLLCYPSAALQKLVPCMDQSAIVSEQFKGCVLDILNRPVMSFLLQQHNLEVLQLAMRQALRKAACRVYAMQVKCLNTVTCHCRGVAYCGVLIIQPSPIWNVMLLECCIMFINTSCTCAHNSHMGRGRGNLTKIYIHFWNFKAFLDLKCLKVYHFL